MAISNILVGTDESDEAAAAAMWAATLARECGAHLEFFEAVAGSAEAPTQVAVERRAETIVRLAGWLAPLGLPEAPTIVVQHGEAVDLLTDHALQEAPDLVVVGSQPTEGTTHLAIGSTVHALAHQLTCPVVTVPAPFEPTDSGWIVVGIDGSDASRFALRWAADLAVPLQARVCAVYAYDALYDTFTPSGPLGHDEDDARRELHAAGGRAEIEFVERSAAHPADALREVAEERSARLIVVAARQRGSLHGFLLGATPDRLLHRPPRPVALLPHSYVDEQLAALAHRERVGS